MSLGFTPSAQIYGANAALLNKRLISWQHIDAAGIESDQLILTRSGRARRAAGSRRQNRSQGRLPRVGPDRQRPIRYHATHADAVSLASYAGGHGSAVQCGGSNRVQAAPLRQSRSDDAGSAVSPIDLKARFLASCCPGPGVNQDRTHRPVQRNRHGVSDTTCLPS